MEDYKISIGANKLGLLSLEVETFKGEDDQPIECVVVYNYLMGMGQLPKVGTSPIKIDFDEVSSEAIFYTNDIQWVKKLLLEICPQLKDGGHEVMHNAETCALDINQKTIMLYSDVALEHACKTSAHTLMFWPQTKLDEYKQYLRQQGAYFVE